MSDDDEVTDREAFERFVLRSQASACAVAYSALGDRALSEDVDRKSVV